MVRILKTEPDCDLGYSGERQREDEGLGCFAEVKSDRLKFVLYLVREARMTFEAAAASRWVTWCVVVGGPASWLIKTH